MHTCNYRLPQTSVTPQCTEPNEGTSVHEEAAVGALWLWEGDGDGEGEGKRARETFILNSNEYKHNLHNHITYDHNYL